MQSVCFTVLFLAALTFAASPAKADSTALSETLVAAQDTVVDTIYVIHNEVVHIANDIANRGADASCI